MCECRFVVFVFIAVVCSHLTCNEGRVHGQAARTPGSISKEKCKESANLTVFTIPIGNSQTLKLKECTLEKSLELTTTDNIALQQEFPHMALLGFETDAGIQWGCAGSLISDRFVLTAGTCVAPLYSKGVMYVRVGINKKDDQQYRQDFSVIDNIVHPNFNQLISYINNIGLVKLNDSVKFSPQVRPACLYTESEDPDSGITSGWGKYILEPKDDLRRISLDVRERKECDSVYRDITNTKLEESQLCFGLSENTTECKFGSGWPLQVYSVGKEVYCTFQVFGVSSLGKNCTTIDTPIVYTKVSNYVKWIEDIVWPEDIISEPISDFIFPDD